MVGQMGSTLFGIHYQTFFETLYGFAAQSDYQAKLGCSFLLYISGNHLVVARMHSDTGRNRMGELEVYDCADDD